MATNQFDHGPDRHPHPLQANSEQMDASERSASSPRTERSQLGVDFQPSDSSVICGHGKASYDHPGNRLLRMLASTFVTDYSQAGRKLAKSTIVANIVTMIRQGGGAFCMYKKGAWFEVGNYKAREKVSALLRDKLHTQYRSSAKAKAARRRVQTTRNKMQAQPYGQQLVDGSGHSDSGSDGHSDDSTVNSTDSLGFDYSMELDFFDIDDIFSD
jgi:hypothetical protein